MENGISIFEQWLGSIHRRAGPGAELDETLEMVASEAEQRFGARVWFARVMGRRWSYVAGVRSDRPTRTELRRTGLGSGIGMIVESWGDLSSRQGDRLEAFARALVLDRRIAV